MLPNKKKQKTKKIKKQSENFDFLWKHSTNVRPMTQFTFGKRVSHWKLVQACHSDAFNEMRSIASSNENVEHDSNIGIDLELLVDRCLSLCTKLSETIIMVVVVETTYWHWLCFTVVFHIQTVHRNSRELCVCLWHSSTHTICYFVYLFSLFFSLSTIFRCLLLLLLLLGTRLQLR